MPSDETIRAELRIAEIRMGRPRREDAVLLAARVVETATVLFLRDGYARTTMEAVAAAARVSKRTLYRHHPDKPALLRAVVAAMVTRWRPPFDAEPADTADLAPSLLRLGRRMLAVALSPDALALYRLATAEAARFPEIVHALHEAGVASGIGRIARLIAPVVQPGHAAWAAEQFQRLVVSGPQARALGFGARLDDAEQEEWVRRCVALFTAGIARGA